jgi:hypothetical protein
MMKICQECEEEFNLLSPEKKKAGGLATTCPSCSEETAVKYAGVQSADGKGAQASILKFQSEKDRTRYIQFWQNNSGLFKSKNCQIGKGLSTDPGIKFETIVSFTPTNHKGKA